MINATTARENVAVRKAEVQADLLARANKWLDETVSPSIEKASKGGDTSCNVELGAFAYNEEALNLIGRTLVENGYQMKRFPKCSILQVRW